jgi:hypothetical protein
MRRVLFSVMFLLSGAIVWACGDKLMLVMGIRGSQMKLSRPAAILGYTRPDTPSSKLIRELQLQAVAKKSGHRFEFVDDLSKLDIAVRGGKYDLVVADISLANEVSERLGATASRPVVLPVAVNAAKAEQSAAQKRFHCLLRLPGGPDQYLDAIDQALQWKTKRP